MQPYARQSIREHPATDRLGHGMWLKFLPLYSDATSVQLSGPRSALLSRTSTQESVDEDEGAK